MQKQWGCCCGCSGRYRGDAPVEAERVGKGERQLREVGRGVVLAAWDALREAALVDPPVVDEVAVARGPVAVSVLRLRDPVDDVVVGVAGADEEPAGGRRWQQRRIRPTRSAPRAMQVEVQLCFLLLLLLLRWRQLVGWGDGGVTRSRPQR